MSDVLLPSKHDNNLMLEARSGSDIVDIAVVQLVELSHLNLAIAEDIAEEISAVLHRIKNNSKYTDSVPGGAER